MTELRRDPVIGQWVAVESDESSWGPERYDREDHSPKEAEICQFCPGREHQTPPEVDAVRGHGSMPNGAGWKVRVVPNKFPALRIEGELDRRGEGIYDLSNGVGAHEVLIETPDHFRELADLSVAELSDVIRMYQTRSVSLARDKRFKYILIFKNFGRSAGTSVEHAHSQIIALPMVPKYVMQKLEGARQYHQFRGRCVYCDIIQQEQDDKERIIVENDGFIAFCPFVPCYPFESWIIPKSHHSAFVELPGPELHALAAILRDVLVRLKTCLGNPSYNFYLQVAPVNGDRQPHFHWHIEILPQIAREAGYEWGTNFYMVRTSPNVAAKFLRETPGGGPAAGAGTHPQG